MNETFVGIDVSKAKIDAFIYGKQAYRQFNNDFKGFDTMIAWLVKVDPATELSGTFICFEHTGLYSLPLATYLEKRGIPYSMTSPLQIKKSMGIARGKNDQVDARRIAEYAFRHRDILQPTKLPSRAIFKLQPLLTLRDRLVRSRAGFEFTIKEQKKFLDADDFTALFETYSRLIVSLKIEIKQLEKEIKVLIQSDPDICRTFDLITEIKGVGLLVGAYIIAATHNFTRFQDWRKFACYAGIAPFDFQSGTSVKGKPRVNHIANKQVKKILHLCALCASSKNKEMVLYYKARLEAGYNKMSTLNAIRNKMLARIFAVVKRQTEYVELMKHVA
ncbi:MAG TPA: transposase [Puia sp.]|uniref:transposase n=1 Tax=Puia sp. TaxID=2045100 RepID=UPI002B95564C|nr:transposase [Puia sp.]HVU99313.1 transposase [Puia sp.]